MVTTAAETKRLRDRLGQRLRPFLIKPKKLRKAKSEDLKKIVRGLSNVSWAEREARNLGFQLTEKQIEEVQRRFKTRIKRNNTLAIKKANQAFVGAIFEIRSECSCGSTNIKARTASHHHAAPGPIVIGPGGNPGYTSHEIVCLYCEDCGLTYYNSQVERLSQRYADGEFEPNTKRLESSYPWSDLYNSFR